THRLYRRPFGRAPAARQSAWKTKSECLAAAARPRANKLRRLPLSPAAPGRGDPRWCFSRAGATSPRVCFQPEPDDFGLDGAEGGDDTVLDVMNTGRRATRRSRLHSIAMGGDFATASDITGCLTDSLSD